MTQQEFLKDVHSDHHRTLLWIALEATKYSKNPVLELGAGYGSTDFLLKYCTDVGRQFSSLDNNREWAEQWGAKVTDNWNDLSLYGKHSVVLVDQGPGESRRDSISILKDDAEIIVVHDAEPESNGSYRLDYIWPLFKYRIFTRGEKVWTAALSNHINLHEYENQIIENIKIEL